MAQVDVTINDRSYRIACDDGQEEHLTRLAAYIDGRVQELTESVGQVGESRLLVMASLLVADELSETLESLATLQDKLHSAPGTAEDNVADAMESLADRIERIAARLEAA
jgi:cell division protein ZapA